MKTSAWLFAAAMGAAGLALAQSAPQSAVTESTDPAKIAEIERHAQDLAARTQSSAAATTNEHQHAKKPHSARHHKHKAKNKSAMQDNAPSDQPATIEGK
ncbi:hypothetical protein [Massilia sp. TWR1-2-2]|uniref:hypothetical protein n=1 Tax=Massilia sp. TWR1-2-2 TaxID=2804584 RepID=UPI003CF76E3D